MKKLPDFEQAHYFDWLYQESKQMLFESPAQGYKVHEIPQQGHQVCQDLANIKYDRPTSEKDSQGKISVVASK